VVFILQVHRLQGDVPPRCHLGEDGDGRYRSELNERPFFAAKI
jgi:hypothetical protein